MKKRKHTKKPRTAAQKRATAKLVALMKAKRKGKRALSPRQKRIARYKHAASGFRVEESHNGVHWTPVATFKKKEKALQYGRAVARANPRCKFRLAWD